MKIFFLNPPYPRKISRASRWPEVTKSGTLYYPFWLAYACGFAQKKGHEVFLFDAIAKLNSRDDVVDKIKKFNPDLLVIETTTPTIYRDIETIDYLRERGVGAKIVVVGSHPTALPEETLKMSENIDFLTIAEYDFTVEELARNLATPEKVKGLAYLKAGKYSQTSPREPITDLDSFPFVSKIYQEFLDVNDYGYTLARHPMIQIFYARGCPNHCVFCNFPQTLTGRTYRKRSKENFIEELEYIKREMPEVKEIFIEDDTFAIVPKDAEEICEMMIKKKLNLTWSVNARVSLPLKTMQKMKKAGCRLLVVGYESGNDQVLLNIKKGTTVEMQKQFAENARKAGLKVFGCFMLGLPGETKETMQETFELAKELKPDMVFFQQAVPFPGTEFYDWAKAKGFMTTSDFRKWFNPSGQLDTIINYPELSRREIEETRDRFMKKFYSSPGYIWRTFIRNLNPRESVRVLKGFWAYLKYRLTRKETIKSS